MSEFCGSLERFVDGELTPVDAENFRHHLTRCEKCETRMKELVAMELLADDAMGAASEAPAPNVVRGPATWRRKTWLMTVPVALAAGLATLVLVSRPSGTPDTPEAFLAQASTRGLEARLTHPGADRHRPYEVMRSEGASPRPLPMRELAELEEAGDDRGVAVAFLLRGDLGQASAHLDKLPASPDADSDRAVLALQRGEPEAALALLERALKQRPQHPQALWNRGLALQGLGLWMKAAESFEQVAALKEPGWSQEAAERARQLRQKAEQQQKEWKGTRQDCQHMVEGGAPLSPAQAEALPGMARVCLYNALRTADSPERVESLRPLAVKLDAKYGGSHLEDALRRTARGDFSVRVPLARDYVRLTRGELKGAPLEAFITRLRDARQEDMLLGALGSADARQHGEEYRSLALATRDPWFALLAEEREAKAETLRGEPYQSLERLEAVVARACGPETKQDYRCLMVRKELGQLGISLHRPLEARAHLLAALELARSTREWGPQRLILELMAQAARTRNDLSLARAYLEELVAQTPESCADSVVPLLQLSLVHHRALDFAGAREQLDRASRCAHKPTMARVSLLAELARTAHHQPADTQALVQELAALRGSGNQEPGALAMLDHVEGRFFIEQDRQRGQQLLRQVLAETAKLPASDESARKARVYSYTSLILDAARHGELERGLALFAEERALPLPDRCVLGVTVDDERTFVVARDAAGRLTGHYDAGRKAPLAGVEGLVPTAMVEALRACPSVAVLARPPVQGRADLLPSDLAWSYRLSPPAASEPPPAHERRLVVSDVLAPAKLRLPALRSWSASGQGEGITVLSGAAATPPRVLEAMREATEVQVHAHGIIDPGVADASVLVLSPAADTGRFALATSDLRGQRLRGRPVVLLAACYAAHTSAYIHENFGLPLAFIESGARAVLAATQEIPDAEATAFFEPVLSRIRSGVPAAVALRDERQDWLRRHGSTWVRQVLLFE
ncbi:CHAT domain-containing protein [Pyxidicoccus fallax]|uniref:CHAT domain-containing protein n=1 Tax=Pyxidicoccus fallax TaxID=394095 RepID=A0A848L5D5_9BACT|nr:CHAT domain-containing protein [Pyxidicoccus fallax]NMO14170.1 CHAT domain-containing protein [Pyxidicoccus fallax]NPC85818.1 CHAT domain-containing protein [Pyxidicoccus fallax]